MGVKARAAGWNEERLHRWLRARGPAPGLAGSPGHDAAVLRSLAGRPALCVDTCVEGVHVEVRTPPRSVGRKAAARALSDLAATAATPRGLLAALCAPADRPEAWLRAVLTGIDAEARRHGAALVGGDLCCAPGPAVVTVTALGEVPAGRRAPGRDRARPGQVVALTGPVGGSRMGRHLHIEPRLAAGRWLWERGATALMDISDGLARDLDRLARASRVRVDLENVPAHRDAARAARRSGRAPQEHALHDGEDHELIAALPASVWAGVEREARRGCPGLVRVGRVRRGRGLYLPAPAGVEPLRRWDGAGGWLHGEAEGVDSAT